MSIRMQKLQQLLQPITQPNQRYYEYLPVSTSYKQQLVKEADELLGQRYVQKSTKSGSQQFQSNEDVQNIKNDLILLKLKGYIDPRDITSKSTQIKKLPTKVQVGHIIEGDPIQASKMRNKKKTNEFIDYFLSKDNMAKFTNKKFTQIQKLKQRKKKIKKRIIAKKQKESKGRKGGN